MRIIGGGSKELLRYWEYFTEKYVGRVNQNENIVADYSRAHKRQSFTAFKCWRRRWNYATQYISKRGVCAECYTTSWGGCAPCICIPTSHLFVTYFSLYLHSGSKWLGQVSKCGIICDYFWVQQIAYFNEVLTQKNYELWKIRSIILSWTQLIRN